MTDHERAADGQIVDGAAPAEWIGEALASAPYAWQELGVGLTARQLERVDPAPPTAPGHQAAGS